MARGGARMHVCALTVRLCIDRPFVRLGNDETERKNINHITGKDVID